MRILSSTQSGRRWIVALALLGLLGLAGCHEANGTERVPGTYPNEEDIDRPKGGEPPAGDGDGDMGGDGDGATDSGMTGDGDGDMGDAGMGDAG